MTDTDASLLAKLEEIQARADKATDGPWAWESIAEKSNEFAVGLAWDKDGQPVRGEITDDPDAMQDTIIERRLIGLNETGHANFADAAFIAHAREDIPYLLDALRRSGEALRRLQEERDEETPCLKREDGQHCNCWYDGGACCACEKGVQQAAQSLTHEVLGYVFSVVRTAGLSLEQAQRVEAIIQRGLRARTAQEGTEAGGRSQPLAPTIEEISKGHADDV